MAHDLWLQPSRFWIGVHGEVPAVLLVGHGAVRERSQIDQSGITTFRAAGPGGTVDRKDALSTKAGAADASLKFDARGTYVVFFSTANVHSELGPERFNDYAKVEGLTLVTDRRAAEGTANLPGRELYSRRGKALVQVGMPGSRAQTHVTSRVGLSLEIVPLRNPYTAGHSATLPVQVLYQGRPLPGALVKLNDLSADAKPVEAHRTDVTGRATFKARHSGEWQLNVVWSEPLPNNPSAEFMTTFSSLSFGFTSK
ncbi:MAG: DUF4198 domain-containing protein [Pseudomonadota bacterium]